MTLLILTTISLLMAGKDFITESISEAYLESVVSLYCNLPKSTLLHRNLSLEPGVMEHIYSSNANLQSFSKLDYTASIRQEQNIDSKFDSFPLKREIDFQSGGIESELQVLDNDFSHFIVDGHWKEPTGSKSISKLSGTPTAALASRTVNPVTNFMTPTTKPITTSATKSSPEECLGSKRLTSVVNRLKRALSRHCTLSNIALKIPGLKAV